MVENEFEQAYIEQKEFTSKNKWIKHLVHVVLLLATYGLIDIVILMWNQFTK